MLEEEDKEEGRGERRRRNIKIQKILLFKFCLTSQKKEEKLKENIAKMKCYIYTYIFNNSNKSIRRRKNNNDNL